MQKARMILGGLALVYYGIRGFRAEGYKLGPDARIGGVVAKMLGATLILLGVMFVVATAFENTGPSAE